jgi:hypothetical protein
VAGVDDVRQRPAVADEQPGDALDRLLGRRQPDPDRDPPMLLADQPIEALEAEREVGAALVAGDGVDLVDDHRADVAEGGAALLGGEQDVERLRRGDQDVRRPLGHLGALAHRRVAGADADPDVRKANAGLGEVGGELAERRLEVALDVVGQRLERRQVEDRGLIGERPRQAAADELIEAGQERGQRLARAGRRRDQDVVAGGDLGPAVALRGGRLAEAVAEPARDERVEAIEDVRGGLHREAGE